MTHDVICQTDTNEARPAAAADLRVLIPHMQAANPLWGAPRIHGELRKLGIEIAQTTPAKCLRRHRGTAPSQTWHAFLTNQVSQLASIDFFTIPTPTFRVLFVFVVLAHDRQRIVHVNVTAHPAAWTAQQVREAWPCDTLPRVLLRDRDAVDGPDLRRTAAAMGIEQVLTAPRAPWQNPYAERLTGSVRRERLDHVIIVSQAHLRRMRAAYLSSCHRREPISPSGRTRPHRDGSKGRQKTAWWRSRKLVDCTSDAPRRA